MSESMRALDARQVGGWSGWDATSAGGTWLAGRRESIADAEETIAAETYARRQALIPAVLEAVARADAMARLDHALRLVRAA